jgi:hypothetical protein
MPDLYCGEFYALLCDEGPKYGVTAEERIQNAMRKQMSLNLGEIKSIDQ